MSFVVLLYNRDMSMDMTELSRGPSTFACRGIKRSQLTLAMAAADAASFECDFVQIGDWQDLARQ